jgi:hypothetical protein
MSPCLCVVLAFGGTMAAASPDDPSLPTRADRTPLGFLLHDDVYGALELPQPETPLKQKLFETSDDYREHEKTFREKKRSALDSVFYYPVDLLWGEYSLAKQGFLFRPDALSVDRYRMDASPLLRIGDQALLRVDEADAVALENTTTKVYVIFRPLGPWTPPPPASGSVTNEWDDSETDPALICRVNPNPGECIQEQVAAQAARRADRGRRRARERAASPMSSNDQTKAMFRRSARSGREGGDVIVDDGSPPVRIQVRGLALRTADGQWLTSRSARALDQLVRVSAPPLAVENPRAAGTTIGIDEAIEVVRNGKDAIHSCIDDAAKNGEPAPSHAHLLLSVRTNGSVAASSVKEPAISASNLGRCLTRASRKWRFPPTSEEIDLEIPLRLRG